MNLVSQDTAILITAYTGGNDPSHYNCGNDNVIMSKRKMAKTLVKYLRETGYYICLSSHSTLDEETQNLCHSFIYDSDNRWQIDGIPKRANHGVAELSAIHNGVNMLSRYGFKNIFKLCYDQHPDLDYTKLIKKYESLDKKLVTFKYPGVLATMCFYSNIEFFKETFPMTEIYRAESALENAWHDSVRDRGMMDSVYGYPTFNEMLELPDGESPHFAIFGSNLKEYNYE
jgi:hypothetical protein